MLLEDAVKSNQAHTFGDLPDSLIRIEKSFQRQKDAIKKQFYQAKTKAEQSSALAEENNLNQQISIFLKSIKDKYPKYHALKYENITTNAKEVQAVLNEKTLLLEYFVADSATYLFAVTKNKVELFPISITKTELNLAVNTLRKTLSNYQYIFNNEKVAYDQFIHKAHWFYNFFLNPALEGKNIEELIIITDGKMGHLPFEVFLTKRPNPQKTISYQDLPYLIKSYTISYNYSTTLWKKKLDQKNRSNNQQMIAFGASYPNLDSNQILLELRSPHLVKLRKGLNDLPAAQSEVKTLEEYFKGAFFYQEAANEATFKRQASDYAIIHLAMHGILNKNLPILSSLAFTESFDKGEDNFLQAYELAHLNLNADLVVLSACETGYGTFQDGEGVLSLARSFMYAGSPSLIVSLWQVNDASTAFIMMNFYQYLSKGISKDKALRKAKLAYLNNAKGRSLHPAFWSAFIQLGDTSNIQLQKKNTSSYLFIFTLTLSLVFFFSIYWFRKKEHSNYHTQNVSSLLKLILFFNGEFL